MGKKLESNFTNMVVVLFSVTLIASAAVGYVLSLIHIFPHDKLYQVFSE